MLFTSSEKNMLIGAFIAGGTDLALEGYFQYMTGAGTPIPTTDPWYWLYAELNPYLPPTNTLIADVAIPLVLWGVGKWRRKQRVREMGLGAMVYGFSDIIAWYAYKAFKLAAGQTWHYTLVSRGGIRA